MEGILEIQSGVMFDESISHYELHAHQPYTSTNFNNSDEIRISIQHQDLNLLPSRSYIHVVGRLTKSDGTAVARTSFVNNGICHLFEDVRYELNSIEMDRCKNVGLTTVMKGWPSFTPSRKDILENAGWMGDGGAISIINSGGYFDISIPLSMVFGFAEDFQKIVVNMKHELIITRSRSDLNAVLQTIHNDVYEAIKIDI